VRPPGPPQAALAFLRPRAYASGYNVRDNCRGIAVPQARISHIARMELSTGLVAQPLGHKPSATAEKRSSVRPLNLLRQWHSKPEAWLLGQAGLAQDQPPDDYALPFVCSS